MKSIAYSIVVVAGALMATAGVMAEAIHATRSNIVDELGLVTVLVGIVFLLAEVLDKHPPKP